jgi:hypothetical protein
MPSTFYIRLAKLKLHEIPLISWPFADNRMPVSPGTADAGPDESNVSSFAEQSRLRLPVPQFYLQARSRPPEDRTTPYGEEYSYRVVFANDSVAVINGTIEVTDSVTLLRWRKKKAYGDSSESTD